MPRLSNTFCFRTAAFVTVCCILLVPRCLAQLARQASSSQHDSLRMFLRDYLRGLRADEKTAQYFSVVTDLEDDSTKDVIVYFTDRHSCGSGGCTMLILAPLGHSYKVITKITIAWPPVRVLETKSHGWHDLAVRVQGGGIQPGYEAKLSFNGKTYPRNPSMPPATRLVANTAGTVVIPPGVKGKRLD